MADDRRAPTLAKGTYRVERRVVHTSEGIKTVITVDTYICTLCRVAMRPDAPSCVHGQYRWRQAVGIAGKITEADMLAMLSADVARILQRTLAGIL